MAICEEISDMVGSFKAIALAQFLFILIENESYMNVLVIDFRIIYLFI